MRRGNFDFIWRDTCIECNYPYACSVKIEQDFVKLLEENRFAQSAYLVFGHSDILRERIGEGFRSMARHPVALSHRSGSNH